MLEGLKDWAAKRVVARGLRRPPGRGARSDWAANLAGVNSSGFAGAAVSRLTASLSQVSGAVNADLDGSLLILRARARAIAVNNEFGQRFLTLVSGNVVGASGPTLQVRAKNQNGTLDKPANDAIELAWARWAPQADASRRMHLAHLFRVAAEAVARDGEALIRFVRGRQFPMGLGLQLLEADRLDAALNGRLSNGNTIRQGVEIDSLLRPIAYHLFTTHPGENWQSRQPERERVPAMDLIHLYLPRRAEQVRGYTWFAPVLNRMAMLHGYEEAAVVAARVGAAKMGIFVRKDGTPGALAGMADGRDAAGALQMSAEAGEFMEAPDGYELANWDPEYPAANFDSFMKQCLRGVASGLNASAHNLTGDMTEVNYSSARIAELVERDVWSTLQQWFIHAAVLPIYREWLGAAMLLGEITFETSGKTLPADRTGKFLDVARFEGRKWAWVDPAKDVEAAEHQIAAGLASRTQIAASQGREFEDIVDELAQEKKLMDAAGIAVVPPKPAAPAAPAPDADA